MTTAVAVTSIIAGKAVELAFIAAVYGAFRLIAGQLRISAPAKQPEPKAGSDAETDGADNERALRTAS